MDKYTPQLLDLGLGAMIGKGKEARKSSRQSNAISRYIFCCGRRRRRASFKMYQKSEVVAYDDLGTEAIRKLEVEDFPVIVVIDCEGNNLYETAIREYRTLKEE